MAGRSHITRRLTDFLALPPEALLDLPKFTLDGNRQLTIENYAGIIQYDPDLLRIGTKQGEVKITGKSLSISMIRQDGINVAGWITGLTLVGWEEV